MTAQLAPRPTFAPESDPPEAEADSGAQRFRAIFISDVHLGTPGCQAERLLEFLRQTESDDLYLVGDIIDGWQLKRRWFWRQSHNDVVQKVLRKARKGTRVTYVVGNHDEAMDQFTGLAFGGIHVAREAVHRGWHLDEMRRLMRAANKRTDDERVWQNSTPIDVPMFIAHGTTDTVLPVVHGYALAEMYPQAELLIIEGMCHELQPHYVEQLWARWSAFLRRVDGSL